MFGRKIHFSPVSRKRRKSLHNSDKMQRLSCVSKMLLTLYSWVPALALLHSNSGFGTEVLRTHFPRVSVDRTSLRKVKSTPLAQSEQPLVPRCARLEFDPAMGPSPCAVAHDATSPVPALPLTIPGEGDMQFEEVFRI
jgi:hypothetical protein